MAKYTPAEVAALLARPTGRVRNVAPRSDRTYAGVVYDSKAECKYAFSLDQLKASGKILDWSRQIRVPLVVNGITVCNFVIDFCVSNNDGDQEFHEVKGWETPEYKLKLKLFRAIFPKADYRVVKV